MRETLFTALFAAPFALWVGCGAPAEDHRGALDPGDPAAPEDLTEDRAAGKHGEDIASAKAGTQVLVRNCAYVANVISSGIPPRFDLVMARLASPGCAAASAVIDSSYDADTLLTAVKGGQGVAVLFSSKATPSGAGLTHLHVHAVDPESLTVTRSGFLGSMSGSSAAGALYFVGQALLVKGDKEGIFEGEVGSGDHFTAVFPHFLTSGAPPAIFASP